MPVLIRVIPIRQGGGEIAGIAEIFSDRSPRVTMPQRIPELVRMELLDTETGIPNRQFLEMHMKFRLEEYQRYNLPFGILFVDIDHFKKISERHGRINAAKVLRVVSKTLSKNIRSFDVVGRWTDEEFIVVLLNIAEAKLDIVANKLRLLVAESFIMMETGALNVTVSMGATLVQKYDTVESLVKRAEQLMLHSKWLGRNRVSMSFEKKTPER